jgi:hypothetical protein
LDVMLLALFSIESIPPTSNDKATNATDSRSASSMSCAAALFFFSLGNILSIIIARLVVQAIYPPTPIGAHGPRLNVVKGPRKYTTPAKAAKEINAFRYGLSVERKYPRQSALGSRNTAPS